MYQNDVIEFHNSKKIILMNSARHREWEYLDQIMEKLNRLYFVIGLTYLSINDIVKLTKWLIYKEEVMNY